MMAFAVVGGASADGERRLEERDRSMAMERHSFPAVGESAFTY
jgi:hypothetical protein